MSYYKGVREVVLDTETTGLDPDGGDRVIEIGCVELIDRVFTGKVFHEYINPERDIPYYATKIHGITIDMLKDKPKFSEIADKFLEFIDNGILVIHNAGFDIKFIKMELDRINKSYNSDFQVVDTLVLARKKFPGVSSTLDALCRRFNISLQDRKFHGALLDATLLGKVYVQLMGGLQRSLEFSYNNNVSSASNIDKRCENLCIEPRIYEVSEEEIKKHKMLLEKIKNPIWNNIFYTKTE
ncbi:DNA polymerase III, epsilon subunit [Ehrlichia chaffeensis str. Heartland]|uniref:DNA polymerase III subunit epsilon n=1 Tax=Ehrlichia chaffeensis TaxID=945 RepID=UPI000053BA46|nr:DNA polymerase III subunit epsilon [Ehrlichia chaffeensis]AHX03622.1 DNA polymerase III, epsilon subunit [Ehrlichia chaffeensis str. Heartland]AHX05657.1 DNA polymerase III, epsilon subunit [Ehrlichia chaffeensis str. Jax]AHX06648.1 DNA polymerase III, epsilon subunit [Ehrlichia chaffeensis str. Liberty]AHX07154.1 DNA polymerase III, epsilon subunit [Ehrlichia chaffeensis str. Osceola]AHX08727.1 DNA polymerase III, epsilon subunit [Ehrlichia chaffeensis str. Saint Vincent]